MNALLPRSCVADPDATHSPGCSPAHHAVQRGLLVHRGSLFAHARKLTRSASEAEDLVQDTSLRALLFAEGFEPGTNVRAWLHQILHSVFVTRVRSRARERRGIDTLVVDPCAWVRPDPLVAASELSPRVERALAALPAAFGDVVRFVDVYDLSYKDAARLLDVPLGTIMSRLHRGRRLLATALAEVRPEPQVQQRAEAA